MSMYNPSHPGEVLKEMFLDPLELNVPKTAKAPGITKQALYDLINEESGISVNMAIRLSKALIQALKYGLIYNLSMICGRLNVNMPRIFLKCIVLLKKQEISTKIKR